MNVVRIFDSIQGEGPHAGRPATFVRLAGCNVEKDWWCYDRCDTEWAESQKLSIKEITEDIEERDPDVVVWTGGEPLLQKRDIYRVIDKLEVEKEHHLETNGSIEPSSQKFDYIAISPKKPEHVEKFVESKLFEKDDTSWDFKVVVDSIRPNENMPVIKDILDYSPQRTILMPLSMKDRRINRQIKQNIWELCSRLNIRYSPRLQIDTWGFEPGR